MPIPGSKSHKWWNSFTDYASFYGTNSISCIYFIVQLIIEVFVLLQEYVINLNRHRSKPSLTCQILYHFVLYLQWICRTQMADQSNLLMCHFQRLWSVTQREWEKADDLNISQHFQSVELWTTTSHMHLQAVIKNYFD